ncbi:MAG: DUF971 domain-containing protein [Candidatus Latescibacterota bacterium]|nr:DUF971 domain-containing protein [Candidatus Latescibacterota bacterium]
MAQGDRTRQREERKKQRPSRIFLEPEILVISWQDGDESRLPLRELRRECPCAMCRQSRGEPGLDVEPLRPGQLHVLTDEQAVATAEAAGFEPVGRYGLRIRWADGHDTGIHTFESLRAWRTTE